MYFGDLDARCDRGHHHPDRGHPDRAVRPHDEDEVMTDTMQQPPEKAAALRCGREGTQKKRRREELFSKGWFSICAGVSPHIVFAKANISCLRKQAYRSASTEYRFCCASRKRYA